MIKARPPSKAIQIIILLRRAKTICQNPPKVKAIPKNIIIPKRANIINTSSRVPLKRAVMPGVPLRSIIPFAQRMSEPIIIARDEPRMTKIMPVMRTDSCVVIRNPQRGHFLVDVSAWCWHFEQVRFLRFSIFAVRVTPLGMISS